MTLCLAKILFHKSLYCFEYPIKSLLHPSHPKKYLPKFSYPKKMSGIENFNPPKNPFYIPIALNLEYSPISRFFGTLKMHQFDPQLILSNLLYSQIWLYRHPLYMDVVFKFFFGLKIFKCFPLSQIHYRILRK